MPAAPDRRRVRKNGSMRGSKVRKVSCRRPTLNGRRPKEHSKAAACHPKAWSNGKSPAMSILDRLVRRDFKWSTHGDPLTSALSQQERNTHNASHGYHQGNEELRGRDHAQRGAALRDG